MSSKNELFTKMHKRTANTTYTCDRCKGTIERGQVYFRVQVNAKQGAHRTSTLLTHCTKHRVRLGLMVGDL